MYARVATFNVRRFCDAAGGDATEAAVRQLRRFGPLSLLALNEVDVESRPLALGALADALGLAHREFFGHAGGRYGNALLSATPLTDVATTRLDGGSVVTGRDGRPHRIGRGLLAATTRVGGAGGPLVRCAVTHLDHMCEAERGEQTRHVLRELDAAAAPAQHQLLLGDLNALAAADYAPAEWRAHEAHNAAHGWAPPADSLAPPDGCLELLRRAGFDDCARAAMRSADGWAAEPWTAHVAAESAGRPRYRIDYVFARAAGRAAEALAPTRAEVGAPCAAGSDHVPVLVEFAVG